MNERRRRENNRMMMSDNLKERDDYKLIRWIDRSNIYHFEMWQDEKTSPLVNRSGKSFDNFDLSILYKTGADQSSCAPESAASLTVLLNQISGDGDSFPNGFFAKMKRVTCLGRVPKFLPDSVQHYTHLWKESTSAIGSVGKLLKKSKMRIPFRRLHNTWLMERRLVFKSREFYIPAHLVRTPWRGVLEWNS